MSELKVNQISKRNGNNISLSDPLKLKSYTTSQRDALTSANGDMIYNSTNNKAQIFQAGAWSDLGGFETFNLQYLIIGGGASGGATNGAGGGGGGAGGYLNSYASETSGRNSSTANTLRVIKTINLTVTVGAGGSATSGTSEFGNNGNNSSIDFIVAYGGGGGARRSSAGKGGGSGGGGGSQVASDGGTGLLLQGFDGGAVTNWQSLSNWWRWWC